MKNENELLMFVDNCLLSKGNLTFSQYQAWRMKTLEVMKNKPASEKNLENN
jgi:hypothetical protein